MEICCIIYLSIIKNILYKRTYVFHSVIILHVENSIFLLTIWKLLLLEDFIEYTESSAVMSPYWAPISQRETNMQPELGPFFKSENPPTEMHLSTGVQVGTATYTTASTVIVTLLSLAHQ